MCVCVCVCVSVRRHIAKLRQEWFNGLSWNFVGMLGATMPRMYQILVTNQFNLRDYILYYPRDYRFPYRHNASLSLWPDVMTFGNVNYVCWIYEWMNEWMNIVYLRGFHLGS